MRKLHIIDQRPMNIPENWTILNAPRPIPGNMTWQGDFRHGIFYSAMNPDTQFFNSDFEQAKELDAWEIVYYSIGEARDAMKNNPKYLEYLDDIDGIDDIELREYFALVMNGGES